MNYQRIYNEIVDRAKVRELQGYGEKHHIVPKCLGGSNEKENLVKLTAREHYICHKILAKIYPKNVKVAFAFIAMCNKRNSNQEQRYTPTSREYEQAKRHYAYLMQGQGNHRYGKEGFWKDKNLLNTHRGNISIALVGNKNSKGKKRNIVSKERIAESRKKEIYQYTKQGEFVLSYTSIKEAGENTQISRGNISNVTDTTRTAGGYFWKSKKVI